MKYLVMTILLALSLAGCQSLQYAGNSSYSIKPIVLDAKAHTTICCQVDVHDGKETAQMTAHMVKHGDDYDISLSKTGETAFAGQAIAAGATQDAINAAAKAAVAVALAGVLPAILPAAGAALAAPGIGAAAVGAGAVLGAQKISAPVKP
ncbi:MAG: hypothetical protein ABIT70_10940 [Sulfuriferula sp.]